MWPKDALGKQLIKSQWSHPALHCMGCQQLRRSAFHFWWGHGQLSLPGTANIRILSKLYLYGINSLPGVLISYCCCNRNKFSGLTKEKYIILELWRSGVLNGSSWNKIKILAALPPLEALGKNPFSCLFHLLEAVCLGSRPPSSMAWLWPPLLSSYLLCLSFFSLIRSHVITLDLPEYSRTVVSSQNPKVNHISKVPFAM